MAEGGEHSLYIVTNYNLAPKVIQNVKNHNYNRYNINGLIIIDKNIAGKEIEGIPVVADLKNAASYICQQWVDEVFVNVDTSYQYPHELINELLEMGMAVHVNLAKVRSTPGQKQFVETIYSSDDHYELCYGQTGTCQKSTGYPGWTGRLSSDRDYLYLCGTGHLYQLSGSDFLFTDTDRSEWKTI